MSGKINKEGTPEEYLERNVFPTLLPALEELLRWDQSKNQTEKSVRTE